LLIRAMQTKSCFLRLSELVCTQILLNFAGKNRKKYQKRKENCPIVSARSTTATILLHYRKWQTIDQMNTLVRNLNMISFFLPEQRLLRMYSYLYSSSFLKKLIFLANFTKVKTDMIRLLAGASLETKNFDIPIFLDLDESS